MLLYSYSSFKKPVDIETVASTPTTKKTKTTTVIKTTTSISTTTATKKLQPQQQHLPLQLQPQQRQQLAPLKGRKEHVSSLYFSTTYRS